MRSIVLLLVVTMILIDAAFAWEERELIGLPPEQVEQFLQRQQQYDAMTLEILKEKLRLQRERNINPFIDCILVGNVEGRNIEEAKDLARSLGANEIRWIHVTPTSVSAEAYKCSE